jgi:hypothetical protein
LLWLGGNVVGQRVHGQWPGLASEQLGGPGDLAGSTDYRDILAEIVSRLNNPQLEVVFPNVVRDSNAIRQTKDKTPGPVRRLDQVSCEERMLIYITFMTDYSRKLFNRFQYSHLPLIFLDQSRSR